MSLTPALLALVILACGLATGVHARFDRIVTVGDLHGDMDQALDLFKSLGVVSHQPDFYQKMIIQKARKEAIAHESEGSSDEKSKKEKGSYRDDGVGTRFLPKDITANMIFNKRGHIMGGSTADEFHWAAGKTLVVVLGDSMNVGPDDISIIQFLRRLTKEAKFFGGKLVFTLGNHEMNNLRGNFAGVHPWSFERTGGANGRARMLSTKTQIGRFLRSRPGVFYYDDLLFMHGGLFPAAVRAVEKATGRTNMTGSDLADAINTHLRKALFSEEEPSKAIDEDPIAATVGNVDYTTNGKNGILLVHPLDQCKKVLAANNMTGLQAQVVGHTPHELPNYRFCDGALYAVDFSMSQWKGGKETPYGAVEFLRENENGTHIWSARLVLPKREGKALLGASRTQYRFSLPVYFVLVAGGVMLVELVIHGWRYFKRDKKSNDNSNIA